MSTDQTCEYCGTALEDGECPFCEGDYDYEPNPNAPTQAERAEMQARIQRELKR